MSRTRRRRAAATDRTRLTKPLDLRTGRSPWLDGAPRRPPLTRLPRGLRTEVLVVGAGISGILVAHALAERGHEVTLIDRRMPLTGSTAASTALLQFEIDTPLIWEAADPYLYVRSTVDGRVICGGADEPLRNAVLRDRMIARKTTALQRALGHLLPQLDTTPEYCWAGSFGQSDSGLPRIGAIPGHPRCHAVLGFGGNGITWSMMAAEMLSAAVAGIRDPDEALFAFP